MHLLLEATSCWWELMPAALATLGFRTANPLGDHLNELSKRERYSFARRFVLFFLVFAFFRFHRFRGFFYCSSGKRLACGFLAHTYIQYQRKALKWESEHVGAGLMGPFSR